MAKKLSTILQVTADLTAFFTGYDQINNTSDLAKSISVSTQLALDGKQPLLVSGENIKTVGGASILGSGNLNLSGDVTSTVSGSTVNISLAATGVTAGTYNSVTVDAKGRVTEGYSISSLSNGRSIAMSMVFGS